MRRLSARWFLFLGFSFTVLSVSACCRKTLQTPSLPAAAGESGIQAVGRFLQEGDCLRFAWGATRLTARFNGTTVRVRLDDQKATAAGNYFNVHIDARPPFVLATLPQQESYVLADELPLGDHTVTLVKRTEALAGEVTFRGFDFGPRGTLLAPPPRATRRIEIIGDSISAGYGNEGDDEHCPFTARTENGELAYGPLTARALDAEAVVLAWSGRGILRNRDGSTEDTLLKIYGRTLPARIDSVWNFASWTADVVVINLGTNDFALGIPPQGPFVAAYVQLLHEVRANYPKAQIFCTLGPMLHDAPDKNEKNLSAARQDIQAALAQQQKAGDTRIAFLEYPVQTKARGMGCDWHPSLATHAAMAEHLTAAIKSTMGW